MYIWNKIISRRRNAGTQVSPISDEVIKQFIAQQSSGVFEAIMLVVEREKNNRHLYTFEPE